THQNRYALLPSCEELVYLAADYRNGHRLRVLGLPPNVRGGYDGRGRDGLRGRGLALEDVERGASNLAAPEGLREGCFVDDLPSGGVDQERVLLHEGDPARVDHAPGLCGQRDVERDEIRGREEGVEVNHPATQRS